MFTKIFGRREDRPAPPPLEELKKEAMGILSPDVFDGARFEFNKTLTQKFALNHNIFMGSSQLPSSYEFGANFGDERVLLASRTDMAGRLNGRVLAQLTDSVRFRAHAQMQPDSALPTHATFNVDYKGQDFASGLKYASGIMVGVEHMQSVTPNLALGGEYCQLDDSRGGKKIGSVAARCVWGPKEEHVATFKGGVLATLGSAELSYQRKARRVSNGPRRGGGGRRRGGRESGPGAAPLPPFPLPPCFRTVEARAAHAPALNTYTEATARPPGAGA